MRTSYHKRLVVLIESSFVIVKRHKLSHIGVHYFWLRKILQISAVPKVIWCISFVCTLRYSVPILIKMSFDSRVILNMNTLQLTTDTIVSIN